MMLFFLALAFVLTSTLASDPMHPFDAMECWFPSAPPFDALDVPPQIDLKQTVCIDAYLNESATNEKHFKIAFKYGEDKVGEEDLSETNPEFDEILICQDFDSDCELCLGIADIFISDDWAKLCPKFISSCPSQHVYQTTYVDCLYLGDDELDHISDIINGNTDFTFNLLSTDAMTHDIVTDLFVSPFGITNALIMPLMVAEGNTRKQILSVLGLNDTENIYDCYDTLIQALQHSDDYVSSGIYNRLWIAEIWSDELNPQFLSDFQRFGDIVYSDFYNNTVTQTEIIDGWITNQSDNTIMDPLDGKDLSIYTVMLFTNVMNFECDWQYPFDTLVTKSFYDDNDTNPTNVSMLYAYNPVVNRYHNSEVEIIEYPFTQDFSELSFIVIRPTAEKYLTDGPKDTIEFEESINTTVLRTWLNEMETVTLSNFSLPPFIMFNREDITSALQSLGITDLFDPHKADLRNLTTHHHQVYDDEINRQDYIQISETGIKIGSLITDGNGPDDTDRGEIYHAERPFIYLVMDRSVDLVLYAGRITNPNGWCIDESCRSSGNHRHKDRNDFWRASIAVLLAVLVVYLIIRYFYNTQVLRLSGMDAFPHISTFRWCRDTATKKWESIKDNRSQLGRQLDDDSVFYDEMDSDDNGLYRL